MVSSQCCQCCLRVFLLVTNIIFLIIGDVLIGAGIYFCLFDDQETIKELKRTLEWEFLVFRVTLISVGCVIVVAAFSASAGVVLKSRCTLILYSVLLCITILFCSATAIVSIVVPTINQSALNGLDRSLKRSYGNATLITKTVDYYQTKMNCCGWQQKTDLQRDCNWFNGTAWQLSNINNNLNPQRLAVCPASCCADGATKCSSTAAQSCSLIVEKYLIIIPLVAVAAVIISLCHLLCALILVVKGGQNDRQIMVV